MKQKGFTVVELISVGVIITVVLVIIASVVLTFMNNRGATETRAVEGANKFISDNGLETKRVTCAGDSDGDGYGACAVTLTDGERIRLECPTNFLDVKLFGASSCKEVFYDIQGGGAVIPAK